MKTYPSINYQEETLEALEHLRATCPRTVALRDMERGFRMAEPYLVIFDQCIRIAKNYEREFEIPIADDHVAGDALGSVLSGVRSMLNFDGAAKWEAQSNSSVRIGTDTKDNGVLESLYWKACEIAGLNGDSL